MLKAQKWQFLGENMMAQNKENTWEKCSFRQSEVEKHIIQIEELEIRTLRAIINLQYNWTLID